MRQQKGCSAAAIACVRAGASSSASAKQIGPACRPCWSTLERISALVHGHVRQTLLLQRLRRKVSLISSMIHWLWAMPSKAAPMILSQEEHANVAPFQFTPLSSTQFVADTRILVTSWLQCGQWELISFSSCFSFVVQVSSTASVELQSISHRRYLSFQCHASNLTIPPTLTIPRSCPHHHPSTAYARSKTQVKLVLWTGYAQREHNVMLLPSLTYLQHEHKLCFAPAIAYALQSP